MQIAVDEGWFDMASLVAIARCNKQLKALVDRDYLWKPFLAEIKFPQTGFVDDTDWISPDIPSLRIVSALRVPPRIKGGRRDDDSFFVHLRDKEARGRGLHLAERVLTRFDQTTGILEDHFCGETCVFIPRALPIECKACRVMLDSYPALVAHCKQWSHRQNMDDTHGRRVPEEFVDPRNTESYHELLSVFGKVMALKTFEHKFNYFLRATIMDQNGIDRLMILQQWSLYRIAVDPEFDDEEDLLSMVTQEKIMEAIIAFVLVDFHGFGIERYSLDVLLNGWHAFRLCCGCCGDCLYSIITGPQTILL